jgi:hypothetical protein
VIWSSVRSLTRSENYAFTIKRGNKDWISKLAVLIEYNIKCCRRVGHEAGDVFEISGVIGQLSLQIASRVAEKVADRPTKIQ